MPSRVLVTGATGFLGQYVVREFVRAGAQVLGIGAQGNVGTEGGGVSARYCQLRLPDPSLADLVGKFCPDVCIHCAGPASVPASMKEPLRDYDLGPRVTVSVLDTLRRVAPRCRFVLCSSAAVYGTPASLPVAEQTPPAPLSAYGFHKWQSELLCREYSAVFGLRTASLRIFSAYGSGLRRQVIWDTCSKIHAGDPVYLHGTGRESRDFVHASDVAQAVHMVVRNAPMHGESYNVGSGQETSIACMAAALLTVFGEERQVLFDGVVPSGVPLNWQADITAGRSLGFECSVLLEQGLRDYVQWFRHVMTGTPVYMNTD